MNVYVVLQIHRKPNPGAPASVDFIEYQKRYQCQFLPRRGDMMMIGECNDGSGLSMYAGVDTVRFKSNGTVIIDLAAEVLESDFERIRAIIESDFGTEKFF